MCRQQNQEEAKMKATRMTLIMLTMTILTCMSARAQTNCVPPPSGLVSWWPGDGNATDITGGNNGILSNGTTFAAGEVAQAFSFDGVDDEVVEPHNPNQNTGSQITVDAWVYPTALSHGRTIIQKRSASN